MAGEGTDLVLRIDVAQERGPAFEAFAEDLVRGLAGCDIRLMPAADTPVTQADREIGRVLGWMSGERILLRWRSAEWTESPPSEIEIQFESREGGTRISVEYRGWAESLGELAPELPAWFAGEVAATVLQATAPRRLGDWFTDRRSRRPSGAAARDVYRDPRFHRPGFRLLLARLRLTPEDYLLEVGCGGGAFMRDALQSGCRAAALDHSLEMVRLARAENHDAVRHGRFEAVHAEGDRIPFAGGRFTCAATMNVFGFFDDPLAALSEIHRVLLPGGRLVLFTISRDLVGAPAAPEPMASRFRFYEDEELRSLALRAGFAESRVERPDLEPFAREAGLAEDAVLQFRGESGGQLLTARKG